VVGATRNQLAYWDRTGLVSPSIRGARGRGSRRLYSVEDIFELKILVRLLESPLSLQRIRSSFSFIRGQSRNLSSFVVFTDGKTVYFYEDYNTLVDTLRQGQTVLRITVQELIEDVQHQLIERGQIPDERSVSGTTLSGRTTHRVKKGGRS